MRLSDMAMSVWLTLVVDVFHSQAPINHHWFKNHIGEVFNNAVIDQPFQIQQYGYALEAFHKVCVNVNPWFIINHHHFFANNNKIHGCMNCHFSCNENNVMHKFYNLPANIVTLVFLWNVFQLKKIKQQFHRFKVSHRTTLFQKPKNCNKLYKLFFFPPNHIPHNNHVSHCVFSPIAEKSLILCMLWFNRHVILPHITIWFCNLVIVLPNMFLEVVEFGNQDLLSTFNLQANTTLTMFTFPFAPSIASTHGSLGAQTSWKIWLISHSFTLFFLLHGFSVRHITTFCCCTKINLKCNAPNCITNNNTTTTFIWGTNLDDTRDVSMKKKLVVEPIR